MFSASASSGSFNRSGVNYEAGARTPLASVFASIALVLVLLVVAPLAAYLPNAAMGGILFLVAWGLIDFHHIGHIWHTSKAESAILAATLVGIFAERRWPQQAGVGSRRSLIVLLYVVLPPVIFENLAHADFEIGAGIGLGLGLITVSLVGLAGWVIAVPILKLPRPVAGAVICCSLVSNTGYLCYPMVLTLMGSGRHSASTASILAMSNSVSSTFCLFVNLPTGKSAPDVVYSGRRSSQRILPP